MTKKDQLKQNLVKSIALHNIYTSTDFVNHLLPYLKELATVQYVDPTQYKSQEEYMFALDTANRAAGVYNGILRFLSSQEAAMNKFRQLIDKPEISY